MIRSWKWGAVLFFLLTKCFIAFGEVSNEENLGYEKCFESYFQLRITDPNEALSVLEKAFHFVGNDEVKKGRIYYHLGYTYKLLGMYERSMTNYMRALSIFTENKERVNLPWLYIDIGNLCYQHEEKWMLAEGNYNKARSIFQEIKDYRGVAVVFYNFGLLEMKRKDYPKALIHFKKSLHLNQKNGDLMRQGHSLDFIGDVYTKLQQFDSAVYYYQKTVEINEIAIDTENACFAIPNWAELYEEKGDFSLAVEFRLKKDAELKTEQNIIETITNKQKLSELYQKLGLIDTAVEYASSSLFLAEQKKLLNEQKNACLLLYELNKELSNEKEALAYYERYSFLRDSIKSIDFDVLVGEFQIEQARKEKDLLVSQGKQFEFLSRKQRGIMVIIALGLVILSITFIYSKGKTAKLRKEFIALSEKNELEEEVEKAISVVKSKNNLDDEVEIELRKKLERFISDEKVYLNPTLTLEELARLLETNRTYLSKLINRTYATNFTNFLNLYRIKEAQRILMLEDAKKYTIESIAKDAGFRSKSTFNAAFKKFTGDTPSGYVKNCKTEVA